MNLTVRRSGGLHGEVRVPGDKSITHRALLLGALSQGPSWIRGYLDSGDCRATLGCLQGLGIAVEQRNSHDLVVHGKGLHGWQEPSRALECVRSGTTMRLLAGCLAGQALYGVLDCDAQLSRRPMDRVAEPLRLMGAQIWGRQGGRLPPLSILEIGRAHV